MKPLTVFYCDDDEDDLLMFADVVKEIDESIECVTSLKPELAFEQLSHGNLKPDVIFLDINMPRLNGLELLLKLKKLNEFRDTPIVMYTTSTQGHEFDQCNKLADGVLTKPFDPHQMKEQLKDMINNISSSRHH